MTNKKLANTTLRSGLLNWRNWWLYIAFILLIVIFSSLNSNFFSIDNFGNIGRQAAMTAILSFGMTFVLTTANVDLSVGAIIGLTSMVVALSLQWGLGFILSSIIGILVGLTFGLINGVVTTKLKIPSFLVTLGTLSIARGLALTITNSQTVVVYDQTFKNLWGAKEIFHVPASFLWVILFLIIGIFIYNYTIFGNHVKATGGNIISARFSGISTDAVIIKVFLISGFCAGIAGLIMTSRLGAARPEVAEGMELSAIAAVIIGGTSLFGGKGSIIKSLVGALIMTTIINGLIILGVPAGMQRTILGLVIIGAVSLTEN
jgi:ribose transport system permease protein